MSRDPTQRRYDVDVAGQDMLSRHIEVYGPNTPYHLYGPSTFWSIYSSYKTTS